VDNDRRVLESGAIAIQNQKIVAVGTTDELADYEAKRRVNCKGKLITPGFVDCHNHTADALLRGIGEGMSLWPWLRL
jgi:5-methylthioadenosine/S-adenosylhomocysteine deaminase